MGFEILPIEPGEINMVDPIYDVFEITGAQKWIPARFRTSGEANTLHTTKTNHVDALLNSLNHDALVCPEMPIMAPDPTTFQDLPIPPELSFKA